ncbi:unnamed protein product [Chrysodeixis includens]|uniref:Uncharacterized protein n=1 Tax=Chrysodeixis includens TaxID=689277 RepID=A0A9N8PYV0_CHRIL|nr:unnamed protein product [Chrysodeixis includens]
MRSPHDTNDGKEFYRDPTLQGYMECTDIHTKKTAFIQRFLRIFSCGRKRKKQPVEAVEKELEVHPDVGRLFSFSEVELDMGPRPIQADIAVQTGSSLEMQVYGSQRNVGVIQIHSSDTLTHYEGILSERKKLSLDFDFSSNPPSDELSILKFFRRARSASMQMTSIEAWPPQPFRIEEPDRHHAPSTEEKEIQVHVLNDPQDRHDAQTSTVASTSQAGVIESKQSQVRKKLRFDEKKNVQSPSIEYDSFEEDSVGIERPRRSTFTTTKNVRIEDVEPESASDVEEPSTSTNREFKSYFWGGGKNKPKKPPAKKKAQLSLR